VTGTLNEPGSFLNGLKQQAANTQSPAGTAPWQILVVDDDAEVHAVTSLVLRNFQFENRPIQLIDAYSAAEAETIIQDNEDICLILLDVVMEHENAGLDFIKFVRQKTGNRKVRIILRTGHPGQAPEQNVIVDYDINDYKDKTELTAQKLRTAIIAALRSWRDITIIDANRKGLQKIIDALGSIFKLQSLKKLASGVLTQLAALLGMSRNSLCVSSGMTITRVAEKKLQIMAASGEYERFIDCGSEACLPDDIRESIKEAFQVKQTIKKPAALVAYSTSERGTENVIYLSGVQDLNEWETKLVDIFSLNAAIAFDNNYLNDELEETQREIIETLGEVAEKRSRETGHHVRRVAEYCQLLGRLYGLSEDEVTLLGSAAPTHDIGKLGIPDNILNKPGPLTPEEWLVMREHPVTGHAMLGKSERSILKASAQIARTHHEHWNGGGYPDGLAEESIPVFGRIVALADVFDALSHDRVYKKAWPIDDVTDYIRRQRGEQFEPRLVDLFLEHLAEFTGIKSRFPD